MPTIERGLPLVERIIERLEPHVQVTGADRQTLDALESSLMVELPPTLRRFLEFDFSFESFGPQWQGRHRFGRSALAPQPKRTSVRKMAEAMTDLGWTAARLRKRVIRLPNLPGRPWSCLYLGEARRDGELPILGLENDETNVTVYLRYTAFDLYLIDQSGLMTLNEDTRHDDLESHLALNSELRSLMAQDSFSAAF